jgi:transitional endoplasmic reticulum ATPase
MTTKPRLRTGLAIADGVTVETRVEKSFFIEVYQLSNGQFLYLPTEEFVGHIAKRNYPFKEVKILVNGSETVGFTLELYSKDILRSISLRSSSNFGLDGVAGMTRLKLLLVNDVINPLLNPDRYEKFRLSIPNGILLFGPPGCGKTFIVKKLSEELSFNFFELSPSAVATPYVHGAVSNINKIFGIARDQAPAIIFIDEIEGLIPKREELGSHADIKKEEINEFLLQLNNAGANKILVVGATNRPQMIDSAILRSGRMDKRIFVPPPDFEARKELFRMFLFGRPYDTNIDFDRLAKITENYVGSDIELIVTEAARAAVLGNKNKIGIELIDSAIAKTTPSINSDEMKMYSDFAHKERW